MSKKDFTFQKLHISGHLSTLGPKLAQPRLPLSPRLNQQLKGELANIMIIIVKWAQSQNVQSPTVVIFSFFQLSVRVNNPWNQGSRNPRTDPTSGWSQTKFPKQPTFSLAGEHWTCSGRLPPISASTPPRGCDGSRRRGRGRRCRAPEELEVAKGTNLVDRDSWPRVAQAQVVEVGVQGRRLCRAAHARAEGVQELLPQVPQDARPGACKAYTRV